MLNGRPFDVQPNLHKALVYLQHALTDNFWIDAVCINQQDVAERTEQVRVMSETYGNASMVASWIGPCDAIIRPLFQFSVEQSLASDASLDGVEMYKAFQALVDRRYWSRMWIQQEVMLQSKVTLFCGKHQQPLYPLIKCLWRSTFFWECNAGSLTRLSHFRGFTRKPTLLKLITYFSACVCKDVRDKVFALISLVDDTERVALMELLPDYRLNLGQVLVLVLRHVRRFSGQKRVAKQLDSILHSLGEPGDTLCGRAVGNEYVDLKVSFRAGQVARRTIDQQETETLATSFVLYGEICWLDIYRCIFSPAGARTTGGRDTWVLDPALSRAREDQLLGLE